MKSRSSIARIITRSNCSSSFRAAAFPIRSPAAFAFSSRRTSRTSPRSFVSSPIRATKSPSNAWCDFCPGSGARARTIFGLAGKRAKRFATSCSRSR